MDWGPVVDSPPLSVDWGLVEVWLPFPVDWGPVEDSTPVALEPPVVTVLPGETPVTSVEEMAGPEVVDREAEAEESPEGLR